MKPMSEKEALLELVRHLAAYAICTYRDVSENGWRNLGRIAVFLEAARQELGKRFNDAPAESAGSRTMSSHSFAMRAQQLLDLLIKTEKDISECKPFDDRWDRAQKGLYLAAIIIKELHSLEVIQRAIAEKELFLPEYAHIYGLTNDQLAALLKNILADSRLPDDSQDMRDAFATYAALRSELKSRGVTDLGVAMSIYRTPTA